MTTQTPEQFAESLRSAGQTTFAQQLARRAVGLALTAQNKAKSNATQRMRRRSGNLNRSITATVQNKLRSPQVVLTAGGNIKGGKEVPYATTQEYGATIRPVRRQWLAIPTDDVKTGSGQGAGASRFQTPRDYPSRLVFVQRSSTFAFLLDPADGRAKWWLRKKTVIKPKWYARDAMRDTERQAGGDLAGTLADALGAE